MPAFTSSQFEWLRSYYLARAIGSICWIIAAITANSQSILVPVLFVAYPAWDAIANLVDARANGGLRANRSQALNVLASSITTLAVLLAVTKDSHAVLAVFGIWAILSGLLQLATAVGRWRSFSAQWAMALSGAQSTLAGALMIRQSLGEVAPTIVDIIPYAAFGAFYFLISASWMTVAAYRTPRAKM